MRIAPISVIIPCYCCSQVLPRAVNSVLRQSVLPAEIILVDDASPDHGETRRCIEDILCQYSASASIVRIRALFLINNQGPGGARNAAWDIASERFIAFLDADDSWASRKIEIQYEWMLGHPEFILSSHESLCIDDSEKTSVIGPTVHFEICKIALVFINYIPTRSVMVVNRPEYRFPPTMRYAEDYYLWLNMAVRGIRMAKIKAPLAFSYKREYGEDGLSGNLHAMHEGVLKGFCDLRRSGLIGPFLHFAGYVFECIKYARRILYSRFIKGEKMTSRAQL